MSVAAAGTPTNSVTTSGTTPSVTTPTGVANNEVMWLKIGIYNDNFGGTTNGTTITPPTGFTLWQRVDWEGVAGGGNSSSTAVFTKLITNAAGEPASYDFVLSAGSYYSECEAIRFTGCDTSTATAHRDTQSGNSGSAAGIATFLSVAVARNGSLFVAAAADDESLSGTAGLSPGSWTLLQRFDGNVETWALATGATPASGNFTQDWGSVTSDWMAQLFVLQPPSAPSSVEADVVGIHYVTA